MIDRRGPEYDREPPEREPTEHEQYHAWLEAQDNHDDGEEDDAT